MNQLDFPITDSASDKLGRDGLAAALAQEIETLDVRRGAVVAIAGPWGSGKSSLLNLTHAHLKNRDVDILEFNPWLYTGAEHLAGSFLAELANLLEPERARRWRRADSVAKAIQRYGELLVALRPVPGGSAVHGAVTGAAAAARGLLAGKEGLEARRNHVVSGLGKHARRVVVLMDDLDRLDTAEIREVLRMVRLVASFPNVVYVLCLDRDAVARALEQEGRPGHDYLDKFLTVTCDVPRLGRELPPAMVLEPLDEVLAGHGVADIDVARFAEVYHRVLRPLLRTPRDAKRLTATLPLAIRNAWPEVSVEDLIALEALRVCAPALHRMLDSSASALTSPGGSAGVQDPKLAGVIDRFVAADVQGGAVARGVIEALFPAAHHHIGGTVWAQGQTREWARQRRVAAGSVLDFYLSRLLPPGKASHRVVEEVRASFTDVTAARAALAAVEDSELLHVLERLEDAELDADAASVAVEVMLDLFPRLPESLPGPFSLDASFAVTRPVLRYLRRLPDAELVPLVDRLVVSAELLGAFHLVMLVGHREGVGHALIPLGLAEALEARFADRLRGTPASDVAATASPLELVYHTLRPADTATSPAMPQVLEPVLTAALLRDGLAITRSGPLGGPLQPKVTGLHWDVLVALFGGGEVVLGAARAQAAAHPADADLAQVAKFAAQYADGWRPPRFGT